jgi:hypothetical protein
MVYPTSTWTLADIMTKVRNITGTPSTDQMSDIVLVDYINKYYSFIMPFELKEQITLEFLDFKLTPNQDVYDFTSIGINFLTDQPMAYADGFPLIFYQDPDIFYQDWPQQYAVDSIATGTGGPLTINGGLQNPPVIVGTLFITDGVTLFQDNGDGTFSEQYPLTTQPTPVINASTGSIDYITGAINLSFTNDPAASATIYAKYQGYEATRPQGVLFFENSFTFRPVPDQVYAIRMQGYIQPTQLIDNGTIPIPPELGQVIAYGASLDIFSDRGDIDRYNEYYGLLKRFENVALARTVQQFQAEQGVPRF